MPPEHRCPFPETGCTSKTCNRRRCSDCGMVGSHWSDCPTQVCATCGGDGVTSHNATAHPAWETTVPCPDCVGGAA